MKVEITNEDANDLKNAARSIISVLRKAGRNAEIEVIVSCAKAGLDEPHETWDGN